MPSELLQITLNSVTIAVAIALLVLGVALIVLIFVRSTASRREREALMRERQMEMEREAQFATAAERIPLSRKPSEVASLISELFRDYLSIPVVAVYAARQTDSSLSRLPVSDESEAGVVSRLDLPDGVPSSLLEGLARPTVDTVAVLATQRPAGTSVPEQAPEHAVQSSETSEAGEQFAQAQTEIEAGNRAPASKSDEDVLLLPWRGPFGWNGLIVGSLPAGIAAAALDPYGAALERLTNRLAIALELEQNDVELEAFEQRASRITRFSRSLISCLEEASPLDSIVRKVTELVGSDSAALWRVDESNSMVTMVAASGLKSAEFLPLPVGQGLAGSVAQSGEQLAVEDAPADPRCIFPREARESGIASYLGAPLIEDGKTLGVIEVHSASRRPWSESDRRALESAADIITELVRSTDSRGNRLRVESAYLGLSEALQRLRAPDEVKEAVVEVLGHALGASRVIVVEFNDQGKAEPVKHEYRQPSAKSALGATFGDALVARAQASTGGEPVVFADSREQSLMDPGSVAKLEVFSELALPIRADGKARAIVYVHQCEQVREWEQDEIEFAERVTRQLSLSLANLRSLELAFTDAAQARAEARRASEGTRNAEAMLTGLPEMVVGLDRDGRVSFFNIAAKNRLGLTSDDLGHAADLSKRITAADKSIWEKIAVCENVVRFDGETEPGTGENDETPVSISAAPIRDDKGEITGRLIVATELSHLKAEDASARIRELERKLDSLERVLVQSRDGEEQARAMLAKASALEAKARAEADVSRRAEAELHKQLEDFQEQHKQVQGSAQQLIEINRLKSEFIVNAGREIEASLQSVLGLAELLERGSYGSLTPEQREAVHGIYGWARRIKSDVDWLIEYGSTRSRRLESSSGGAAQ